MGESDTSAGDGTQDESGESSAEAGDDGSNVDDGTNGDDGSNSEYGTYDCVEEDCEFDEQCGADGTECQEIFGKVEDCGQPFAAEVIPVAAVEPGLLFAANLDDDPADEVVIVRGATITMMDDDGELSQIDRALGGSASTSATAGDIDGDGVVDLVVGGEGGEMRAIVFSPTPEERELEVAAGSKMLALDMSVADADELVVFDGALEELSIYRWGMTSLELEYSRMSRALFERFPEPSADRFASLSTEVDFAELISFDEGGESFVPSLWIFIDYAELASGAAAYGFERLAFPISNGTQTRLHIFEKFGVGDPLLLEGDFAGEDPMWLGTNRLVVGGASGLYAISVLGRCGSSLDVAGQTVAADLDADGGYTIVALDGDQLSLVEVD